MKSKQKQIVGTKRKRTNPLMRRQTRAVRPRASFDGQFLNHKVIFAPDTTSATGTYASGIYVDATATGSCMGTIGAAIANTYSQYVYETCVLRWLPSIGPGSAEAGGRVYVGYVDNPEAIKTYMAATTANQILYIKGNRNMRSFNVWENGVYALPLTRRRKMFDVNNAPTHTLENDNDRSTQGLFIFAYESVGTSITMGAWQSEVLVKLHGFNIIPT